MNVRQPEYRLNGRHGRRSHEFLRSPWIKHYKPSPKSLTDKGSSELENQVVSSKGIVIRSSGSASSLKQILREGCSHLHDRDQISIGEEEGISFFSRSLQICCVYCRFVHSSVSYLANFFSTRRGIWPELCQRSNKRGKWKLEKDEDSDERIIEYWSGELSPICLIVVSDLMLSSCSLACRLFHSEKLVQTWRKLKSISEKVVTTGYERSVL